MKPQKKDKASTIKTDDVVVVIGHRGSGKSWLGKKLAQKFPRLIVWNFMLEDMPLGYPVETPKALIEAIKKKVTHIVYNPLHKNEAEFEQVNKIIFSIGYNYAYYVEETDFFARSKYIPFWFNEILNRGRHHGIALLCVARRIFNLNPSVHFNANHIFVFNTTDGRDLTYLRNIDARLEEAKNLPKYHYLWWQRGERVIKCKPVDITRVQGKRRRRRIKHERSDD